jgi:hypothetical protein
VQVVAHRDLRDVQARGDLRSGVAEQRALEHLELALGQPERREGLAHGLGGSARLGGRRAGPEHAAQRIGIRELALEQHRPGQCDTVVCRGGARRARHQQHQRLQVRGELQLVEVGGALDADHEQVEGQSLAQRVEELGGIDGAARPALGAHELAHAITGDAVALEQQDGGPTTPLHAAGIYRHNRAGPCRAALVSAGCTTRLGYSAAPDPGPVRALAK